MVAILLFEFKVNNLTPKKKKLNGSIGASIKASFIAALTVIAVLKWANSCHYSLSS